MSSSISTFKRYLSRALSALVGFIICALGVELLLHLLPVKTGLLRPETYKGAIKNITVNTWEPNSSFLSSTGWALTNVRKGKTNNYGFISPFDYKKGEKALFVIGDSYIEAQMNDYPETVQGILGNLSKIPCYGVGYSGFSLADYIAVAQYVTKEFNPQGLVISISTGDILGSTGTLAEGAYFVDGLNDPSGPTLKRPHSGGEESRLRNITKYSATLRYLWLNLQAQQHFSKINDLISGNRRVKQRSLTTEEKKRLVDFLVAQFTKLSVNPKDILFIVDGDRDSVYENRKSTRDKIYSYFIKVVKAKGFNVLDLEPVFKEEYKKAGLRFDYSPRDGHWNYLGHRLIANQVIKFYPNLFKSRQ
jgi:hypothetical protein